MLRHVIKFERVKINKFSIFFAIMVITPLVDTINGWFVMQHGETGVSIGTFYRLFILLFLFAFFRFNKIHWKWLLVLAYFPVFSALRGILEGYSFISAFTYGLKWMLPGIYILLFYKLTQIGHGEIPLRLLDIWKWLIPGTLIFECAFGLGTEAYYDAGFKGYFYSNNEIGFSLTMTTIFSLYTVIMKKMEWKSVIPLLMNLVAILILSTKSCLIFCVLSAVVFLVKRFKHHPIKGTTIVAGVVAIGIILASRMEDNIAAIIYRYSTFYQMTAANGNGFADFMGFLTSARTYRIGSAFEELIEQMSFFKPFFGWQPTVFTGAIEMDWFDVFFQHGIVGFAILLAFYWKVILDKQYEYLFKYMLIIAMICACFSGHVINGALPSTVFSIVAGTAIYSRRREYKETELRRV